MNSKGMLYYTDVERKHHQKSIRNAISYELPEFGEGLLPLANLMHLPPPLLLPLLELRLAVLFVLACSRDDQFQPLGSLLSY